MKTILSAILLLLLAVSTQAKMYGNKFNQGYYYDLKGQKVEGLINMNPSGDSPVKGEGFIVFKEDNKATEQKLSASMINSFVVGIDSFTVAPAPKNLPWSKDELDFIRVVVDTKIKMYEIDANGSSGDNNGGGNSGGGGITPRISTGIGFGGGFGGLAGGIGISLGSSLFHHNNKGGKGSGNNPAGIVYYYGPGPGSLTLITKENFIDAMSEIMSDEPDAVDKIKSKKYKLADMEDLVKYYYQLKDNNTAKQ